jgi:hypothetical protein
VGRQLARRRAPVTNYDDDEPEDAPFDAEDDEPVTRRSRRNRDDDDEPRGRARSRRSRNDDDDEPPARSRRSRSRDDDDDEPRRDRSSARSERGSSRRSRDEEPPKRAKAQAKGGWDTVETNRASRFSNPGQIKVKDKEILLKFLEEEPFASYGQHWVGQRSYTCGMNADYQKCPLCSVGNPCRYIALFNILDMDSGENRFWEVGPEATKTLMEFNEESRTSPLNKDGLYFAAKRFKKDNGFYGFKIERVKEAELEDEFDGIEPLDDDELDQALENLFTADVIQVNTLAELRAAAKEDDRE